MRRTRRRPGLRPLLPRGRPQLRVLLALQGAGCPPGSQPGGAPGDRRGQRHEVSPGYDARATARWAAEQGKEDPPAEHRRGPFVRDRARVLHSSALRRLAAKTQVVEVGAGDFPRTRLTHSLECAQIGREFGAVPGCGGFEGNAQSLRLLTRLEAKVAGVGLNLTRATLDATIKYPWRAPRDSALLAGDAGPAKFGYYADDAEAYRWIKAGAPEGKLCLEAQVMDWADDVAYSVHDLEDGLHAGHITIGALHDRAERAVVVELAQARYCRPGATVAELEDVFGRLLALPYWPASVDGGPASLVALKYLTSELIARFCGAAQEATLAAAGGGLLTRYAAD